MKKRIKMLEYTDLDDSGVAHDIIRQRKIDVASQSGKHSTDEALTFYCANSDEVKEGEPVAAHVAGSPPFAVYDVGGTYYVTDNICTHGNAMSTDGY
ncbi:hypothetical protein OY671_009952, partial [Metschnikowia pulcherrima]